MFLTTTYSCTIQTPTKTGNRIVLFAPVYLANWCVNTCQYCAFRGANKQMQRSMLTMDELRWVSARLQYFMEWLGHLFLYIHTLHILFSLKARSFVRAGFYQTQILC